MSDFVDGQEDWLDPAEQIPIPPNRVRFLLVQVSGLQMVPTEPVVVCWDDSTLVVRTIDGRLRYWSDGSEYSVEHRGDLVCSRPGQEIFPDVDVRYMDLILARSLDDMSTVVNAGDEIEGPETDGSFSLMGITDDSRVTGVIDLDSGVVLEASGSLSGREWTLLTMASELKDVGQNLLREDIGPISISEHRA